MKEITVKTKINAPVQKVWKLWSDPQHIIKWNTASEDWHTPRAENDLRPGGQFLSRMEARDGSMGFDFTGTYDEVVAHKKIRYTMTDGRKVKVNFNDKNGGTEIEQSFEPEDQNPREMQREGWQTIMNNFRAYVEAH